MKTGKIVPRISLPAIDGTTFDNNFLAGKRYLITFFRFASCPFCNMRMAQLVKSKESLDDTFEIVAVFESEIEHLKKHASEHFAKFPILADATGKYYKSFGVRKSFWGMLKGMVFRFPTLISAVFKGYIPKEMSSRFLIMPMSMLVDEKGIIQRIYHGKDEGDHLPLKDILAFANV